MHYMQKRLKTYQRYQKHWSGIISAADMNGWKTKSGLKMARLKITGPKKWPMNILILQFITETRDFNLDSSCIDLWSRLPFNLPD